MTAKKTSYESTIEKLGRPAEETTFRIGEIDGEFRVELYNIYPNDKGQNANVEIREATWHRGENNLTIWFHKVDGKWVEVHRLTWDKDAEF